jgi:hypothetical protein
VRGTPASANDDVILFTSIEGVFASETRCTRMKNAYALHYMDASRRSLWVMNRDARDASGARTRRRRRSSSVFGIREGVVAREFGEAKAVRREKFVEFGPDILAHGARVVVHDGCEIVSVRRRRHLFGDGV